LKISLIGSGPSQRPNAKLEDQPDKLKPNAKLEDQPDKLKPKGQVHFCV